MQYLHTLKQVIAILFFALYLVAFNNPIIDTIKYKYKIQMVEVEKDKDDKDLGKSEEKIDTHHIQKQHFALVYGNAENTVKQKYFIAHSPFTNIGYAEPPFSPPDFI